MFYGFKVSKKWLTVMIWSRGHQKQKQEAKKDGKVSHLSFDLHKLCMAHTAAKQHTPLFSLTLQALLLVTSSASRSG